MLFFNKLNVGIILINFYKKNKFNMRISNIKLFIIELTPAIH